MEVGTLFLGQYQEMEGYSRALSLARFPFPDRATMSGNVTS
jgi:hypothetical protein